MLTFISHSVKMTHSIERNAQSKEGPKMTAKDYRLLVKFFRETGWSAYGYNGIISTSDYLIPYLQVDNPKFDEVKFLAALAGEK